MSAMLHIATTLAGTRRAWPTARPEPKGMSRTEAIRDLLAQRGELTAQEIARAMDLDAGPSLISALLKNDLQTGRVERIAGRPARYRMSDQFDEDLHDCIAAATALLRRNGFTVTRSTQ